MINYVFEFNMHGDIDIPAKSLDSANKKISKMTTNQILAKENGRGETLKCVGTRNEDGSITYFEEDKDDN